MGAPKLRPGTPMEARTDADGDKELRTLDGDPLRPRSMWHRARWWLHHHLTRENTGEWEDIAGWGASRRDRTARRTRRASGLSREQLREDVRLGQHAQQLREEAATKGGREERARFYGTGEHGVSGGGAERRITVADADRQRAAYEAEQAQRFSGRRRAAAEFRLPWEG